MNSATEQTSNPIFKDYFENPLYYGVENSAAEEAKLNLVFSNKISPVIIFKCVEKAKKSVVNRMILLSKFIIMLHNDKHPTFGALPKEIIYIIVNIWKEMHKNSCKILNDTNEQKIYMDLLQQKINSTNFPNVF